MVPDSPANALGAHALTIRSTVVQVVRSLHDRMAEAHQISGTSNGMLFASQWRDLLLNVQKSLIEQDYRVYRLPPAGYKIPVVNGSLIYVWRVPDGVDVVARFATSSTRQNSFTAPPLQPALFEGPDPADEEPRQEVRAETDLEDVVQAAADGKMPLVLVMVHSSPAQLQSIEWAVATLDTDGQVKLHGTQTIWAPELDGEEAIDTHESFDSGAPITPSVEPRRQEGTNPDA